MKAHKVPATYYDGWEISGATTICGVVTIWRKSAEWRYTLHLAK